MEEMLIIIASMLAIIAISMVGAYVPYIRPLSDAQIHTFIALSAGIFIGVLFFLLFPEAIHESEGNLSEIQVMTWILVGFLAVMTIEVMIEAYHVKTCPCGHNYDEKEYDDHHHGIMSISAFVGLGIHACVDGLMLASALYVGGNLGLIALVGMCIHKFIDSFSLSSTFLLSNRDKRSALSYLFAFAMITPTSALISYVAFNGMSLEGITGVSLSLSTGTFMYVALCGMLPEAFHREEQDIKSFIVLLVGIAVAAASFLLFGHSH
ncbi:MAG: ZIP family metal transporter [archaeon]|nr:ZIP family metal transporter [archaeon]